VDVSVAACVVTDAGMVEKSTANNAVATNATPANKSFFVFNIATFISYLL
jgi:hypothetical protein